MTMWLYVGGTSHNPDIDNVWEHNSATFHVIFKRVAYFFRHFELEHKIECFTNKGFSEDEIDLTEVSKKTFNIFCLRTKEALNNQPDFWHLANDGVIKNFNHIISMLENDTRYDPEWINDYQREMISRELFDNWIWDNKEKVD